MSKKIRAFIAISLPERVLKAIAKLQETLKGSGLKIRWTRIEGIHLTIKFLGDIYWDDVEKIHEAMEQTTRNFSPFTLRGKGVGVFPDIRRPRVVWAGITGDIEELGLLQRDLENQLDRIGFPKERRAFKGHLTLGRVKGRVDLAKLSKALEAAEEFQTEPFTAESVVLFQSDLRPNGAVYSRLAEVPL